MNTYRVNDHQFPARDMSAAIRVAVSLYRDELPSHLYDYRTTVDPDHAVICYYHLLNRYADTRVNHLYRIEDQPQ